MKAPSVNLPSECVAEDLLTIGYGGKKPGDFFAELEALKPDIIVDVRENPFHAFLGAYTKKGLEMRFRSPYIWIKELGNTSRVLPPTLRRRGLRSSMYSCNTTRGLFFSARRRTRRGATVAILKPSYRKKRCQYRDLMHSCRG
jgi:hypothetical protein